ncbi:FYVE zinc finger-domain-containing protein [Dipodascopsis tothii]|uniref:FYVE zinc finger-domain-containing protein n=1 Tax=Dipodascopsis tothii TaxID=44089 RepID=UPI0034CE4EDF
MGEFEGPKSKFIKYLNRAAEFTPVQALNTTLAYADISDLNFTTPLGHGAPASSSTSPESALGSAGVSAPTSPTIPGGRVIMPPRVTSPVSDGQGRRVIPDKASSSLSDESIVSRAHWRRDSGTDLCADPKCRRLLTNKTGKIHCRSCGRLFCDEHVPCQTRLSRKARWDPKKGVWCRVCEACFVGRPGYGDTDGAVADLTADFAAVRRKTVDKAFLEVNLLEKRLTKLIRLLVSPPPADAMSYFGLVRNYRKQLEQTVVPWQDSAAVTACPLCTETFTFTLRKHHCRLCGRVVCGSPVTECSVDSTLDVALVAEFLKTDIYMDVAVDVRMCRDCRTVVFGRRTFAADLAHRPELLETYDKMVASRDGIEALLPRFQRLLSTLGDPDNPPPHNLLEEASTVRKRLLLSFAEYDRAAKRIWRMPTTSATQEKLQAAIHMGAANFLQLHMLPLKSLPNVLKHSSGLATKTTLDSVRAGQ